MSVSVSSAPPSLGLILTGFMLGFGGAFGWALGSGLIALVAGALMHGAH